MIGHIGFGVSENCINIWSYGEICVHCGCCEENEPDEEKRLINQLVYYTECLAEENNFSNCASEECIRKIQEENVKKNIEWLNDKIARINWRLEQLKEQK